MLFSSRKGLWLLVAQLILAVAFFIWWFNYGPSWGPRSAASKDAQAASAEASPASAKAPATGTGGAAASSPEVAALEAARKIFDARERSRVFGEQWHAWIARDPEAALAYLRGMPRGREYSQALLALLEAFGRRDPDRALALAAELIKTREERYFYSSLFDRLARENIQATLGRLAQVPAGDARQLALRAVADAWARVDLPAATKWLDTLTDSAESAIARETVYFEIADKEPVLAIVLAQQYKLSAAAFDRIAVRAVSALATTNIKEAASLVSSSIPPGETQTRAAIEVARVYAQQDIAVAIAWLDTLPDGATRQGARNAILTRWVAVDAEAAARHVAQLSGSSLEASVRQLTGQLATRDPQHAASWSQALPAGTAQEIATLMTATTWAQRDPVAALQWAASLPDERARTEVTAAAFLQWKNRDQNAAAKWLESTSLSDALKSRLNSRGLPAR